MANVGQCIGVASADQRRLDERTDTKARSPEALAARLGRPLVLVGLMGAGKSCIGRRLATVMGLKFFDADAEFEASAGCTISDYFARFGEPAFREGERKIVSRLLSGQPAVIATGGGAFCDRQTRAEIQDKGISIWLRADLDLLIKRTQGRTHRPLLRQGNPREILARLMETRYPLYAEAKIIVDSVDDIPEVTVCRILDILTGMPEQTHGS